MGLLAPNGHIPRNYFLGYGIKLLLGGLFLYVGVRYEVRTVSRERLALIRVVTDSQLSLPLIRFIVGTECCLTEYMMAVLPSPC
jgi:hypothetical protein